MVWTVTALAGLAAVGGFLQFAPVWHPLTTWLSPVARPFAEPTNAEEAIASIAAVLLGLAGMAVAYRLYAAKSAAVPKALAILEHKFYWDELYAAILYKPADLALDDARPASSSSP